MSKFIKLSMVDINDNDRGLVIYVNTDKIKVFGKVLGRDFSVVEIIDRNESVLVKETPEEIMELITGKEVE